MKSPDCALAGSLRAFSIQDIMSFLGQVRASGSLEVEAEEGELTLFWGDGLLIWSDGVGSETDTAEILLHRGKVGAEEVAEIQREGFRGDLAAHLVERGVVDEASYREVLAERVGEAIYRVFLWHPIGFRFVDGAAPPEGAGTVALDPQGLLLEGARRCDEWERLPEAFRDPRTTFELVAEPKSDDMVSLSLDEWRHLYLVNGCRTLAGIWEASPVASDLEVSAILFGLASARLIRPERPTEEADETVAEPPGKGPTTAKPAQAPQRGLETLSLDALEAREREEREKKIEEATTKSMPPSSIKRLSLSQVQIRASGRLVVLEGSLGRGELRLEGPTAVLGRSPECELVLPDGHVSGRHAQISRDGHQFVLQDLGSANGLLVGGKETRRSVLRGGEVIEIYPYRFRFELDFDVSES